MRRSAPRTCPAQPLVIFQSRSRWKPLPSAGCGSLMEAGGVGAAPFPGRGALMSSRHDTVNVRRQRDGWLAGPCDAPSEDPPARCSSSNGSVSKSRPSTMASTSCHFQRGEPNTSWRGGQLALARPLLNGRFRNTEAIGERRRIHIVGGVGPADLGLGDGHRCGLSATCEEFVGSLVAHLVVTPWRR